MDFVDWKLPLTCAYTIKSRIWLSHPSASSGVRGSVLSSSCTPHSACKVSPESGSAVPNGGPLIFRQFVICVGVLFFWRERVRRPAAARTTEQASNLLCGPFLSCQIELMIYPLWQQVSCSHTGCPVMQYTPRLIFTPSLITLDSGVWMNLSSCSYCYLHMRKASDPELSSWTLLIGSCL